MKFGVIGLGRFGYHVATTLAENGMEVLAIDNNEAIVASIRDNVTQAICMRVNDESSLRSIGIDEMDTVIVAMGENFAQSVLVTALLKKHLHIKKVITRAISDIHKEILMLIGADQVILPEKEIGIRLADNLSSSFTDLIRLTPDFFISQITAPKKFVGKTVQELDLFTNYQVHCIGLKKGETITSLEPSYILNAQDKLICAGNKDNLELVSKS
jgi:trk system potassium uptake protein TrkA